MRKTRFNEGRSSACCASRRLAAQRATCVAGARSASRPSIAGRQVQRRERVGRAEAEDARRREPPAEGAAGGADAERLGPEGSGGKAGIARSPRRGRASPEGAARLLTAARLGRRPKARSLATGRRRPVRSTWSARPARVRRFWEAPAGRHGDRGRSRRRRRRVRCSLAGPSPAWRRHRRSGGVGRSAGRRKPWSSRENAGPAALPAGRASPRRHSPAPSGGESRRFVPGSGRTAGAWANGDPGTLRAQALRTTHATQEIGCATSERLTPPASA